MTYGPKQVVGITAAQPRKGYFGQKEVPFGKNWGDVSLGFRGWTLQDLYTCKLFLPFFFPFFFFPISFLAT